MGKRKRVTLGKLSLAGVLCLGISCITMRDKEVRTGEIGELQRGLDTLVRLKLVEDENPPCLAMVKEFCDTLYSPENQGTLSFTTGNAEFHVLLGRTYNDFEEKDFEFLVTKIRSWKRLPNDLREILGSRKFREKMRHHLTRLSRLHMTFSNRVQTMRDEEEISSIWNLALRETVLIRMEKRFPGFARIKEDFIPLELRYESQRQRRILLSQVAAAMWSDHHNWKKVEQTFERIRHTYRIMISENTVLPDELRRDWLERLDTIRLMIPGTDPEADMENCFRTESNAYYFFRKNYITICAGDFNTEEIEETLAHEIGHAFDLDRTRFLYLDRSVLGEQLRELKAMSCGGKKFRCEGWRNFRNGFVQHIERLMPYISALPELHQCLKGKETKGPIPGDYIARIAKEEAESIVADLAERNTFLRIISPDLPLPNGTRQSNPMYLNPCGYYLWDTQFHPLDEDATLLLFFAAEYRCSEEKIGEERFKHAIEVAKELQTVFVDRQMQMEGEHSGRNRLNVDGYAASPAEQFADFMGQRVFAMLLNQEPNLIIRRGRYLANNAWMCRRPSLQQLFPNEAKVQKHYYVEPHSETGQRQKELLTREIQETLQCQKDFEVNECSL